MPSLSDYGSKVSKYITDPRELPIMVQPEAQMYIKTGQGTCSTFTDAFASGAFTAMAKRGAQASVSVADTYVTCASLTGRGRLYTVVAPTNTGAVYKPTIRLTLDGTVYTFAPSGTIPATYRMILGATIPGIPGIVSGATYATTDFTLPNSFNDQGFSNAMSGEFYSEFSSNVSIVPPEVMEAYNIPFLQFNNSCLIEFKTSLLASGTGDKIGGAVYRMLPT